MQQSFPLLETILVRLFGSTIQLYKATGVILSASV
ncbi:hypothetical protein LINPERHAP2_LOCUS93 [Linum perenne]